MALCDLYSYDPATGTRFDLCRASAAEALALALSRARMRCDEFETPVVEVVDGKGVIVRTARTGIAEMVVRLA